MIYILIFLFLIVGLEIYYYVDFLSYSYPTFIEMIRSEFPNTFLIDQFPYFFTEQKFNFLHILVPTLLVLQCISFSVLYKYKLTLSNASNLLITKLKEYKREAIFTLKSLTAFQTVFLILIASGILFSRIYLINRYPFSGDEALSYFTFINNGFLLTTSFYPEPNNHIFYNLVVMLFNPFIENPIYVMRLPNVILNIVLLNFGFLYLLKKRNFTTAILFLIITGFSFSTSIYAVQGRGYMLISLFTVVGIISGIELVENSKSKLAFVSLIVASILGIYTIPIFLFIFVGIATFLGFSFLYQKRYADLLLVLKYIAYVTIGWTVLYLPIFCVSGIATVFNNDLIIQHNDLWHYFTYIVPVSSIEAVNYILGTYSKGYYIMCVLILFIFYTYKKTNDTFLKISLRIILTSIFFFLLFMIVKRVFGEFRVFTMYGFLFAFIMALYVSHWINKIKNDRFINTLLIAFALFYILLIPITFDKKMSTFYESNYIEVYQKLDADITFITSEKPKNIFVACKGYLLFLKLYNVNHHSDISLYTPNSKTILPFDYVIVGDSIEFPKSVEIKKYKLVIANPKALIFKRNGL